MQVDVKEIVEKFDYQSIMEKIDFKSIFDEVEEKMLKRDVARMKKDGVPVLEDKEAIRRWRLSRRAKDVFFEKYHVSEQFIESQKEMLTDRMWRDISTYQVLSVEFIVRNINRIDFSRLRINLFVNQADLEENGVYLMARLMN